MRKYIKGVKAMRPQGWGRRDSELWLRVESDKFIESVKEHSKDGKINILVKKNREGNYYLEVDQDFVFGD